MKKLQGKEKRINTEYIYNNIIFIPEPYNYIMNQIKT